MVRSPWFWLVLILIATGVALSVVLGAVYWLLAALAMAVTAFAITYLAAAYAIGRAPLPQMARLQGFSSSERIPIIFDGDITMGRLFREVDDGLVLLYLLGEPRVELLAVTCTYGNGPLETTTRTTRRLLAEVAHSHVNVWPGASEPDQDPETNQAAQYLVEITRSRRGEIALVATGSMTNLKHAAALDPEFFHYLQGLYLMGGVSETLIWNGRRLAELNLSLDPEAAYLAVHAECAVTIAPGEAGLSAVFRAPQYAALQALGDPVTRLIARRIRSWFALMRVYFRDGGFAMWDSVAAVMLTRPGLLEYERGRIISTRDQLNTGQILVEPNANGPVRVVRAVLDTDGFFSTHFAAWHHLGRDVATRRQA
jgi:purine nucleosidase